MVIPGVIATTGSTPVVSLKLLVMGFFILVGDFIFSYISKHGGASKLNSISLESWYLFINISLPYMS